MNPPALPLTRREAVIRLAALLGATLAVPRLLAADPAARPPETFTPADLALLDEIADTILPPTDVPGAKAAGVGPFIAMMIVDCYEPPEQAVFRAGLARLDAGFREKYGVAFVRGTPADRTAWLNHLDREQRDHRRSGATTPHYFRLMKELTLLGYFTSEIGCTQALRYAEVPGGYDGNAPYRRGDRAWATH